MPIEKLDATTPDLTQQNIEKLLELFPECRTEGTAEEAASIDFDLLRQALSKHLVEGPAERYRLDWPGKRQALLTANTPIDKTLRPMREESVDFDTTRNLFIEGDNLDALKLLQETYLGKVKMIYIDPPYNTGKDFVYRDRFAQRRQEYEEDSGQRDEAGGRLVANPETRGRYHSDWLTMLLPRLRVARNMLTEDGLVFISIDDAEQASLKHICNEIFGEKNFVAQLTWEKGRKNDAKFFSLGHEYMLVYARDVLVLRERGEIWREEKPGAKEIWEEFLRLRSLHGDDFVAMEAELAAWYSALPKSHPSKKWSRYKRIDKFGPWRDRDISWPGGDGPKYNVIHPETNKPCAVPEAGWRYASPDEMQRQIKLGLVEFRADHTEPPFRKAHIRPIPEEITGENDAEEGDEEEGSEAEFATQVRGSVIYKQSQVAVRYLRKLMGGKVFSNPKDHEEIAKLIEYATPADQSATIMDFFAGSGTTAEAVLAVNAAAETDHRFVVVQLPENLDDTLSSVTGAAKKTVKNAIKFLDNLGKPHVLSELTKERVRRAGRQLVDSHPELKGKLDIGFRSFRIDSGNFVDTSVTPKEATQEVLLGMVSHIKDDRSEEDLLFGALLRWGVDITLPIDQRELAGHKVWLVDAPEDGSGKGAALIACFAKPGSSAKGGIDTELADAMAELAPLRVLFRDDGFADDATKENVHSRFQQRAPDTQVKVL